MTRRGQSLDRLSYGVGSVGTGIFTTVPSVLLLYFLTVEVRLDAALAGTIILVPKALGLIGDPLIGTWADRLRRRSPIGRQLLMAAGALLAGTGLWALFALPQHTRGDALIPVLIFFACTTGYSLFAVPYSALPAELDGSEEGRRALVSTRLGMAFLGVLLGGVSAPMVAARVGYPVMGAMMGVVCVAAMGAFLITCPLADRGVEFRPEARLANIKPPRLVTGPFAIQMLAFVLLLAAAGAFSSLLPFLVHDMGKSPDFVGLGMLVDIVAALLTSALWPILIRRLGLRTVWQLAAAVTGCCALTVGTASGPDLHFFIGMAIGGAGLSGVQIAGFTGLADLTATHLAQGRGGGLVTGIWMAGEKAGLASGPLLAGFGLKFLGLAAMGSAARTSIALIPAALAVAALVIITFDASGRRASPIRFESKRRGQI